MKNSKKPAKKIVANPIRVNWFTETDSEELFATFTLVFYGLVIPGCGAFYTRKGRFSFQLPYQADFDLPEKDHAEISEKLSAALKDSKTKKPPESDSAFPF